MSEQKPPSTVMTAQEYAKITAVVQRINGLRQAMWAAGISAVILSLMVFVSVYAGQYLVSSSLAYRDGLTYGGLTLLPFVLIIGFLSYRVSVYVARLSVGKFERLKKIEEE